MGGRRRDPIHWSAVPCGDMELAGGNGKVILGLDILHRHTPTSGALWAKTLPREVGTLRRRGGAPDDIRRLVYEIQLGTP